MAVSQSWKTSEPQLPLRSPRTGPGAASLAWLICASLLVAFGLALLFQVKSRTFGEVETRLAQGRILNLNAVSKAEELLPFLTAIPDLAARSSAARRIYDFVQSAGPLKNVGSLGRLRVPKPDGAGTAPLLPLARIKSGFIVRTPSEFRWQYAGWIALYLASFHFVFWVWRWRRFAGDASMLTALLLLTGIALMLQVSLRDPLRDTLEFSKSTWGVSLGCALLLLPVAPRFDYRRLASWCYVPLFAAFVLFGVLSVYGTGPGASDSKVNLGPLQPVEAIKLLLVLFLAGYFARKWEQLRDLREKKILPRWLSMPRLSEVLPLFAALGLALLFFFYLKDLGPALVSGLVFLLMFSVVRGRWGLGVLGVAVLISGFWIGYSAGSPRTVANRINMWLSPWDNDASGGDQLAHAFWALATGGGRGSGPGYGDPAMIPAAHTDLVLPALGEEWGFYGVVIVALLFLFVVRRSYQIALRAECVYGVLLALGLGTLIAIEMLLITGGALGVIPLSGVVSPFLSSGNSAMLTNFLAVALILGVSGAATQSGEAGKAFVRPVRGLGVLLALCGSSLLAKAAYVQLVAPGEYMGRAVRVIQEDGVKRQQLNPRLYAVARQIPRGNIYDRNGVLLATSDWLEVERRRQEYAALGVSLDQAISREDSRHYPFGGLTAHLLGDLRTRENFQASNTSLIERDKNATLQGYEDIRDLLPLLRDRNKPNNEALKQLKSRNRDVRLSIDIRLQMRVAEALHNHLRRLGKERGAVVVLRPATGDVLALVNEPSPISGPGLGYGATPNEAKDLLDRARYGQYPPGSTFKIVTAMAALRKSKALAKREYVCTRLPDGRAGAVISGWRRPVRDDIHDTPHGRLSMYRAIVVSCNAWFAQLGAKDVGAAALTETAASLGLNPGTAEAVSSMLLYAAFGQGPVLVTPFRMARVMAAVAAAGRLPQARWVLEGGNRRDEPPQLVIDGESAGFLASAMRTVVTEGTAQKVMEGLDVAVAGKTGTAQVAGAEPHAWFAGFAPYEAPLQDRIAFAVLIENGGYGARAAAPVARSVVEAARDLDLLGED